MSILVVEDNPVSAKIIEFNLAKKGHETKVVQSGKEALECLESMPEIQLVITDIMMPEMDGLELLAKIKERPEWMDIPVIMCTFLADMETVRKAIEAGCRHYILKPIKASQLLEKVEEALVQEKPVLKAKNEVISRIGLDSRSYKDILESFAAQVREALSMLEKGAEGKSGPEISLILSNLSEGAALIGAERLKAMLDKHGQRAPDGTMKILDSEYPLLLRELKLLTAALPAPPPLDDIGPSEKEGKKKETPPEATEGEPSPDAGDEKR